MKKIISNKEKNLISKLKSQYDIVGTLHHDMVKAVSYTHLTLPTNSRV